MNRKIKQTAQTSVKPTLTRLKELSPENRLAVIEILDTHTYMEAMPMVQQLVGVPCSINLLWKFRTWLATEQALTDDTDLVEQIETFLRQRNGNWSVERIQEAAISFLMLRALSRGDVKAIATITRLPVQLEQVRLKRARLDLDRDKFAESLRTRLAAGLDASGGQTVENSLASKCYAAARGAPEGRQPEIEPPKQNPPNQADIAT
jgi:hypothetical protein